MKAKDMQAWEFSNIITTLKRQTVLKRTPHFNPGFFGLNMQQMDEAERETGGKLKALSNLGIAMDSFERSSNRQG